MGKYGLKTEHSDYNYNIDDMKYLSNDFLKNLNQTYDFENTQGLNEVLGNNEHSCKLEINTFFENILTQEMKFNEESFLFNKITVRLLFILLSIRVKISKYFNALQMNPFSLLFQQRMIFIQL